MSDVVDIEEEAKKYDDEWLLFEVTEVTEVTEVDLPVKGRLLCHSKSRDEIHDVVMRVRDSASELGFRTFFTGDPVPPGVIPIISPLEVVGDIDCLTLD